MYHYYPHFKDEKIGNFPKFDQLKSGRASLWAPPPPGSRAPAHHTRCPRPPAVVLIRLSLHYPPPTIPTLDPKQPHPKLWGPPSQKKNRGRVGGCEAPPFPVPAPTAGGSPGSPPFRRRSNGAAARSSCDFSLSELHQHQEHPSSLWVRLSLFSRKDSGSLVQLPRSRQTRAPTG